MLRFSSKVIPALIFWAVFAYVILQVPYPNSITQANPQQLLFFFVPFFLAIAFTLNLFLKFFVSSVSISLGVIFLLFLKALDSLNFVSAGLTIIAVVLLLSYFRKAKTKSLTKLPKIPRLTSLRRKNE